MKTHIRINSQRWTVPPEALFAPADSLAPGTTGKRGKAVFFSRNGTEFVRKHYERGGWVRRIVRDRYIYTGLAHTRMWREYSLMEKLRDLGLPVPEPVAAKCVCHGPFLYTGDLVTVRLTGAETLGTILRREPLPKERWADLGETLARFHSHRLYHADLNIENILLGGEHGIALIDFDKSAIRRHGHANWIRANTERLLRSLRKAVATAPTFHFSAREWRILIARHEDNLRNPTAFG